MGRNTKCSKKIISLITCIVIGIMSSAHVLAAEVPVNEHLHLKGEICCEEETVSVMKRGELCFRCNIGTLSYNNGRIRYTDTVQVPCVHYIKGFDQYSTKIVEVFTTCTVCGSWVMDVSYPNTYVGCWGSNY